MFKYNLPGEVASLESSATPYPMFYRRFGIRRAVQLVAPPIVKLELLDLPKDSILHYVGDDETLYGPDQNGLILGKQERITRVSHATTLGDNKGPPRPVAITSGALIRQYHKVNRMTRLSMRPEMELRDPRTLLVENYALLPHLFRYTTNAFSNYYKWWNINTRVWTRLGETATTTNRQHYFVCQLPKLLPTLSMLRRGEVALSRQLLDKFRDPRALFILEMWKWLGPNRAESMIHRAGPEALERMNLVWVEGDRWFVMNMGELQRWRRATREEIDAGASPDEGIVDPEQLQKRFLRCLMMLLDTRAVEVDVNAPIVEGTAEEPVRPDTVVIKVETSDGKTKTVKVNQNLDVDSLGELPIEETEANRQSIDEQIEAELEALERSYNERQRENAEKTNAPVVDDATELAEEIFSPGEIDEAAFNDGSEMTLEDAFMTKVDALANAGAIGAPEYARLLKLAAAYKDIPNPFGNGTVDEHAVVTADDLKISHDPNIPDDPTVIDKSMLSSTVAEFDKKYVEQVLSKDVTAMLLNLQNAGMAVTGYTVEQREDAMGKFEIHKVQITPVRGKVSTLEFRLPVVEADGTFRTNGVRYRQRKQRADVPIRKVGPDKVALTSYYSKVFVSRSEKQVNNYPGWITNTVAARGMDTEDQRITSLMIANVLDTRNLTPRIYSIMAARFRSFNIGEYEFFFDYKSRQAMYGAELVKAAERNNMTVVGRHGKNLLVVDKLDALYISRGEQLEPIGTFETLMGLNGRGPIERAEIKVFGKLVPVGMFLGYQMGLTRLCEVLGVKPRRVPAGERLNLADDEYALRFEDEAWVFQQDRKTATLVLSGFLAFEKTIRNYSAHLFDRKDIYHTVLEQGKISHRYLREMDLMVDLFVDPITKGILVEMGEPTTFVGLVRRATELLETDWAPDETDMAFMRVRGYERIAGAVYSEMVQSIRRFRASGNPGTAKMDLPPYSVSQLIHQDPAVKVVEESNPIHNLKEKEELTYSGEGGRGSRSMVMRTRVMHDNDVGVIGEASKDSADVGVTTFLTADPNLTGLRGLTSAADLENIAPATLISTSMLLAPCADRDDGKRAMFISIQNSSGTFADGYEPMPLRTGYETPMINRVDDIFAQTASGPGKVVKVTENAITIEYEDGTTKAYQLGRRYGTVASLTLPHQLDTRLKEGDTVAVGDLVAYNSRYFTPDVLNPKRAAWKMGVLVKTAIAETTDTLEDSSALSERVARLMATQVSTARNITLNFKDSVHRLVRVGDEVDLETILCTIEDLTSTDSTVLDEESLDTLRLVAGNTPRAKVKGRVEKIEVFYNGDLEEMSDSLQELAMASDRNRKRLARELMQNYTSGKVDESMRVEGNPLLLDNAVIRVYITEQVSAGVGDKGVFGNQMKTIFGRIMAGVNETKSGTPIDAIFGYLSISNRIVRSPDLIGTTNTLMKVISKRVASVYFEE